MPIHAVKNDLYLRCHDDLLLIDYGLSPAANPALQGPASTFGSGGFQRRPHFREEKKPRPGKEHDREQPAPEREQRVRRRPPGGTEGEGKEARTHALPELPRRPFGPPISPQQ